MPAGMASVTPSTAFTCPTTRWKNPFFTGKCVVRFRISTRGAGCRMQDAGCRMQGDGAVLPYFPSGERVLRVVQIAGDLAPARGGEEARGCNRTAYYGIVAAFGKAAARHNVCGWAHGTLNHPQLLIMAHATWDGLQELTRVWMAWLSEDSFTCAGLHE